MGACKSKLAQVPELRWEVHSFLPITTEVDNVPPELLSKVLSGHDNRGDAERTALMIQERELEGLTLPAGTPGEAYCQTLARFAVANNRRAIRVMDRRVYSLKPSSNAEMMLRRVLPHEKSCRFYVNPDEMNSEYDCDCMKRSNERHREMTKDIVFQYGPRER